MRENNIQTYSRCFMIHRHQQNPYRDDTYDMGRELAEEDMFQEYEKTSSQASIPNRSNKYAEEYSFNKNDCFSNKSSNSQGREQVPEVYQPSTPRQEDYSSDRNGELMRKYSSIYHKLLELESIEVIFLFLEEIEENERYRLKLTEEQHRSLVSQQETKEIKALLDKKREAIRRLCETQSYNLNIIQCMQLSSKQVDWDSHFLLKYQQLEKYMNEYIANTNEAQQEFAKSFKLMKMENKTISEANQRLQKAHFECSRELKLVQMRHSKCIETWNGLKERQNAMIAVIEKMKEENTALRQQMEEINKSIRANQQFQIVLSKENKELSSELDFIREKMGENSSLSRDIFEKSDFELYNKLVKEKEELQSLLYSARENLDQALKEKNQLSRNYSKLIRQLEDKQALIEQLQRQAKTTVRPLGESFSYKLKNISNISLESSLPTLPRNCKEAYQYETLF